MAVDPCNTRDAILTCAREIYLEDGMRAMSMRKVAQCAGISATAIYRHFESKEALLGALCEQASVEFAHYLWRGLDGKSPRRRLSLTGMGYLRFALEQSQYYRVLFLSAAEDFGFPTDSIEEANAARIAPTFMFLVDRVRECMEAGVLAGADPLDVAGTIWANSHGLVSLYLSGHLQKLVSDEDDFVAFYERSLDRLIDGLAPRT